MRVGKCVILLFLSQTFLPFCKNTVFNCYYCEISDISESDMCQTVEGVRKKDCSHYRDISCAVNAFTVKGLKEAVVQRNCRKKSRLPNKTDVDVDDKVLWNSVFCDMMKKKFVGIEMENCITSFCEEDLCNKHVYKDGKLQIVSERDREVIKKNGIDRISCYFSMLIHILILVCI